MKYDADGMIDSFLIIRRQNWAFCLEPRARREGQFRAEISSLNQDLAQSLAAND